MVSFELQGGVKQYKGVTALSQVSFTVPDKRITCLVGPNGAGKSTAIKAIVSLIDLNHGQVYIDSQPLAHITSPLGSIGLVLGSEYWVKPRTGIQCLTALAITHGIPRQRVHEVLHNVGLTQAGKRRVSTYSLGMRQRLALAGAMLGKPKNWILDEPFNGLDPQGMRQLRAFLTNQVTHNGGAVLISSHLLAEVSLIADHYIAMNHGHVVGEYDTTSHNNEHDLEEWYFSVTEGEEK